MKSFVLLAILLNISASFAAAPPYGQLSVSGKNLKGASGQNVQLRGMSLFWSQWMDKYYNADTVQALKCSWNTNVVRAAMAVDQGGYLTNASAQLNNVNAVVQAAINQGIYVIIDWHAHDNYQSQAVQFFSQMAQKYAGVPNVLYETFNEPLQVSWTGNLVPYHTAVINAIRQYDTKNIIIVGTPTWSQDVDVASQNPITGQSNIMYTLHYYAGTHKQDLRNKAQTALNNGLPIFVTEYGTVNADGNGGVDSASTQAWWDFLDQNMISYANWAVEDKSEGAAAFIPGTPATVAGVSSDSNLTPSGQMVKAKYKSQSNGVSCSGGTGPTTTTKVPSGQTTKGSATTTKAPSVTTTKPPSGGGNGKLNAKAVLASSWNGGMQVNIQFTNNDSKNVCSATFSVTLQSGQTVQSSWNMDSAGSPNQYKLPSWANVAPGQQFSSSGMSLSGSNTAMPNINMSMNISRKLDGLELLKPEPMDSLKRESVYKFPYEEDGTMRRTIKKPLKRSTVDRKSAIFDRSKLRRPTATFFKEDEEQRQEGRKTREQLHIGPIFNGKDWPTRQWKETYMDSPRLIKRRPKDDPFVTPEEVNSCLLNWQPLEEPEKSPETIWELEGTPELESEADTEISFLEASFDENDHTADDSFLLKTLSSRNNNNNKDIEPTTENTDSLRDRTPINTHGKEYRLSRRKLFDSGFGEYE
ncbi:cellulase (glycosyl hydrolase family 5) domain-containing protein [Ditylenchus destructor]|nr:cellulase (glycosyl hydrolase family 5) domain-containing protein [Ditylenchus destructor]